MTASRATIQRLTVDVGPVVVLTLFGILADESRGRFLPVIYLVLSLPLAFRRLWPFATLVLVATFAVASAQHTGGPWVQIGAVALAAYSVGDARSKAAATALAVIGVAAGMALAFVAIGADTPQALVLPFVIVIPAFLLGDAVATRRAEREQRDAAARRALAESEERVRVAVENERRHVARELHDVVAHGVSVMVIHAGAARQVLASAPDEAERSLLTVESTGRDVMTELRRMLGALNEDGEAAAIGPQPGIGQIGALVERVREAGLPAQLQVEGSPAELPASLDVTAYRIVQEALTNALRYARRAATLVHVSYEPSQLRLEILDDGPPGEQASTTGIGRGLAGMRERAALVGGRLEAGPRLGGGYAVRAWLPLESERS